MPNTVYRNFHLTSSPKNPHLWQVKIKAHLLEGSLNAVKKSIDWWCDTASIVPPSKFSSLDSSSGGNSANKVEDFNGYTLRNDAGSENSWYCMFNGKLIKGSKIAIQKHIEAYLIAKQKAQQQQKK